MVDVGGGGEVVGSIEAVAFGISGDGAGAGGSAGGPKRIEGGLERDDAQLEKQFQSISRLKSVLVRAMRLTSCQSYIN